MTISACAIERDRIHLYFSTVIGPNALAKISYMMKVVAHPVLPRSFRALSEDRRMAHSLHYATQECPPQLIFH